MVSVVDQMEQLDELLVKKELLRIKKTEEIDRITPQEVKLQVIKLEAEYAEEIEILNKEIEVLSETIKYAVAEAGDSVKSRNMIAVYSKPRVSWDSKILDLFVDEIPQIKAARKVGQPSVSIRYK